MYNSKEFYTREEIKDKLDEFMEVTESLFDQFYDVKGAEEAGILDKATELYRKAREACYGAAYQMLTEEEEATEFESSAILLQLADLGLAFINLDKNPSKQNIRIKLIRMYVPLPILTAFIAIMCKLFQGCSHEEIEEFVRGAKDI